jgi:hypothetical protein
MLLFIALFSCSDAELAQWSALGEEGHIVCSSGKIATEDGSDGWFFKKTNRLVRVSGDCVITN